MHRVERRGLSPAVRKQKREYDNVPQIYKVVMLINCSPCVLRIDQDATSSVRSQKGGKYSQLSVNEQCNRYSGGGSTPGVC